jgi:hypothetical protein
MFDDVKQFKIYQFGGEWSEEIIGRYSPHNWFWYDIENYVVPDKMKDKKVALIWGKDKPILNCTTITEPWFSFVDVTVLNYGTGTSLKENENINRINFYWDPNFTDILLKQLYTLVHLQKINLPIENKI